MDGVLLSLSRKRINKNRHCKVKESKNASFLNYKNTGGQYRTEEWEWEKEEERLKREIDCIEMQLILEFIEHGEGYWPSAFTH